MQVIAPKLFNEKSNNSQSFRGKVSPKLYQQRIPNYVDTKFIKAKMDLDKVISKCGDDLIIYPVGRYVAAKIANVNKLEPLEWPMPREGMCNIGDDLYLVRSETLEGNILPHFEKIEKKENNGIDKAVLRRYQRNAIRQALYENLSPEDVVELRKDCTTLLKYQKRNRIGYEKNEEFPFTWKNVKEALEIMGTDPNPSKELLLERQEAREKAMLEEQRKIENSPINRMKKFFGIKK